MISISDVMNEELRNMFDLHVWNPQELQVTAICIRDSYQKTLIKRSVPTLVWMTEQVESLQTNVCKSQVAEVQWNSTHTHTPGYISLSSLNPATFTLVLFVVGRCLSVLKPSQLWTLLYFLSGPARPHTH